MVVKIEQKLWQSVVLLWADFAVDAAILSIVVYILYDFVSKF